MIEPEGETWAPTALLVLVVDPDDPEAVNLALSHQRVGSETSFFQIEDSLVGAAAHDLDLLSEDQSDSMVADPLQLLQEGEFRGVDVKFLPPLVALSAHLSRSSGFDRHNDEFSVLSQCGQVLA